MFSTYGVFPLLIFMVALKLIDAASEQNQGRNDIQTYRSIGLEEMALFLIGEHEKYFSNTLQKPTTNTLEKYL